MAKKRIKDLTATATTSDLREGNYLVLDGTDGTKKFPADKMKPITGTDVPSDPPAYEGQICSVYKDNYPNILVGMKSGSVLVWRQVAISGSNGLPNYNNTIIGGDRNVIDSQAPYAGIFCGTSNKASNYCSVCISGNSCKASGSQSMSLGGQGCEATNNSSIAFGGTSCKSTGLYSLTISGSSCVASGYYSVTLNGSSCEASGDFSVTLCGLYSKASGKHSVTVSGQSCEAGAYCSLTLGGQGCKTTQPFQVAMGQYNDPEQDSGNVLFMVGGGTADNARSNVFTISNTGVPKAMAGQYNVPCCKTGTTAPDTAPDYVGQEYLDTAQKKLYKAFGTTDASDWVLLN